jgi:hypothetical protein
VKNVFARTLATIVLVLVTVAPIHAQTIIRQMPGAYSAPTNAEPTTFTGLVQSVDGDGMQGIVTVRGPKPPTPSSGTQSSSKMVIYVTKSFRLDNKSTITVPNKPKANMNDLRNGDQVEITFVPAPGGQGLIKSITDSGRPKKPTTKTNPPPQ